MDDALCLGALHTISVHMGHHIVAHQTLPLLCHIVINVIGMLLQLVDLLIGNGQSQLLLRLRKGDPELSPGAEFLVRRKDILHLPAGIALRKRAYVSVIHE